MQEPSTTGAVSSLHIAGVRTRFVKVPMRFPLGTSAATVTSAPLLLVDLQTQEGVIGRSYLFCYRDSGAKAIAAVLHEAIGLIQGHAVAPLQVAELLARRYALLGVAGLVRMALAALDIALWDALAVAAGMPLARLLGASAHPVPAYNSDGLGLMPARAAADEAVKLLEPGFRAVKLRLGHPEARTDLEVARAVRRAIGDDVVLMVDYNQALTVPEAVRRAHDLQELNIYWLEEQIHHSDLAGYAQIAQSLDTPVQIGENLDGPESVHRALAGNAADYLMLDAARIGGVSGWLRGAAIAAARNIPVSSHLFPEISVHLLAATPNAHWLEYVSWADAILQEPLAVRDGAIAPAERPGLGLEWSEKDVTRLLAD
ncbi:enolase C-terminal domain-like protein [Candidimonas nitroreducens]|uniref:Mandelate racemase n=1 Tax=Candidimonas nitroreducens TaxID=683354 RepID=A0A225M8U9_9BURK|nr:enolase C-terminal domain-like protein [Candidimonas nitroreducens]OWT57546.1 mandelate racemase [Candidimonas nitroreducens]